MLSALLVPLLALAQQAAPAPAAVDDARARRAWSFLSEAEQDDALARFEGEVAQFASFQSVLVRYARSLEERDPGFLPREAETPFYDPDLHAPGQPIARHRLAPDSAAARKERARMFAKLAPRKLHSAWRYDWATGELVRREVTDAREQGFANALAGFPPGLDLAEALVERALDGGARRRELAAFGHAYTDRSGNVFPGITLYDAWSSGAEMEMPDVDVLGVVHDLLDEWKRWSAPVPEPQHAALYDAVGQLFQRANRYRGLREALAWTFVESSPELRGGYPVCVERFHGLWEANASTPAAVARLLPDAEGWNEFLASCDEALDRKPELRQAARNRRATLAADERAVRAHFLGILAELGAFERTARPAPEPAPAPLK